MDESGTEYQQYLCKLSVAMQRESSEGKKEITTKTDIIRCVKKKR
jgi:hypothetical protein